MRVGPKWLSLARRTAAIAAPIASGNRDGSLPLRSVDTQDSNDIPKNGATRERTNKISKPAASSAEVPDNQSAGGTVSPPAGRASRSGAA
jgi:hypothetical protein